MVIHLFLMSHYSSKLLTISLYLVNLQSSSRLHWVTFLNIYSSKSLETFPISYFHLDSVIPEALNYFLAKLGLVYAIYAVSESKQVPKRSKSLKYSAVSRYYLSNLTLFQLNFFYSISNSWLRESVLWTN